MMPPIPDREVFDASVETARLVRESEHVLDELKRRQEQLKHLIVELDEVVKEPR